MDATRVLDLLARIAARDISVWLDGGWAVDALLGAQTRPHDDLDLVTRIEDNDRIVELLREHGFTVKYDASPSCFVLVDDEGHQVDVHPAEMQPTATASIAWRTVKTGSFPRPASRVPGISSADMSRA